MARIAVIGGTGYAGSNIVAEAVSRGHTVVSVARGGDMEILDTEIAVEDLSCAGRILRPDPTRGRFDRPARARAP